jgi:hypothetical protein
MLSLWTRGIALREGIVEVAYFLPGRFVPEFISPQTVWGTSSRRASSGIYHSDHSEISDFLTCKVKVKGVAFRLYEFISDI